MCHRLGPHRARTVCAGAQGALLPARPQCAARHRPLEQPPRCLIWRSCFSQCWLLCHPGLASLAVLPQLQPLPVRLAAADTGTGPASEALCGQQGPCTRCPVMLSLVPVAGGIYLSILLRWEFVAAFAPSWCSCADLVASCTQGREGPSPRDIINFIQHRPQ